MFFKLVKRNSRRSRKENGLFFGSLLLSIIAFYMILSLSQQDVMYFLREMESDAVDRLMAMIPLFYGMTLVILFFLIYFATKFQLERRRHEFGMLLMMGMRRSRLFALLLAEDVGGSIFAMALGLPAAAALSELVSLITARMVGLGIIGHHFSLSLWAVAMTAAGFLAIKLAAFVILSAKISRQEIGDLLAQRREEEKREKQLPAGVYAAAFAAGALCLGAAYTLAVRGTSWQKVSWMALTLALGFAGTLLLFYGLRIVFSLILKAGRRDVRLRVFQIRQLQENVIRQSGTMAVSSLLILTALCCFGAGVAITRFYGKSEPHVLDYTFLPSYSDREEEREAGVRNVLDTLRRHQLDGDFSRLIEIKTGYIRTTEDMQGAYSLGAVLDQIEQLPESEEKDGLLNRLGYETYPHLISLSGYNELLEASGLEKLELAQGEAAVYMDREYTSDGQLQILNEILAERPQTQLDGKPLYLTQEVQTASLVTDRSITLAFALILPDEAFEYYTQNRYEIYLNGILDDSAVQEEGLMRAIVRMNERLDQTGLQYESYLQNMGRQLFYVVAASYITIYLAVIFLVTANTIIGVQFLMNQQKTNRRYRTLIRLGADYETLCRSAKKQINWYFGIPVAAAAVSSLFAVRALFSGILSARVEGAIPERMIVSAAVIAALCVVEYSYMAVVKRSSCRYLLTLMVPEREE